MDSDKMPKTEQFSYTVDLACQKLAHVSDGDGSKAQMNAQLISTKCIPGTTNKRCSRSYRPHSSIQRTLLNADTCIYWNDFLMVPFILCIYLRLEIYFCASRGRLVTLRARLHQKQPNIFVKCSTNIYARKINVY